MGKKVSTESDFQRCKSSRRRKMQKTITADKTAKIAALKAMLRDTESELSMIAQPNYAFVN